ncbi:GNAT family acetyltransferase (macronuclear) [Tetrahymena thermophila SB210]|uniref:N-alpha-acetyltransferase 60 n=1 Tax=Tetrahymena thermophila (strain SB210) TaxID=312017 RepID=Q240V6_TETTS|nr:GNAT family acetyltransferase [Tetrahymena thermophila SB210]EAS02308.2 GNAT family acetyltransferase [Tetrahymena thermophila SB210]|eukprot:XP_001022553.2 GNAT family acetyltransferase [Tetrahymena thermophila SB210]
MKYQEIDLEDQTNQIQYERISESYPPNTKNNYRYLAEVHTILQKIDISQIDTSQDIISRTMTNSNDIRQIQVLHSEWFPIQYEQSYYDNMLTHNKNLVLELDLSRFGFSKYIIAAVIYNKKSTTFKEMKFSFKDLCTDSYCLYIQTIGVINEFRQHGLASYLLNYIKVEASKNQKVKYINLHMVTYNKSGERFYLKNGFQQIEKCKNYYNIENKQYDSYLFCFYVNGGEPPITFFRYLSEKISYSLSAIKSLVSKSNKFEENDIKMI